LIARSFDKIDPTFFIDFDTSNVPILILSKQEREKHHLSEFQQGLISTNEYRESSGRKKVVSDLADSLLANPNLTPVANTEKAMQPEGGAQGGVPGMDQGVVPGMDDGAVPGMPPEQAARADVGGIETGVPLDVQASQATQQQVTEFSPEEGAFVPLGTVQGTQRIEEPASAVPSELDEEGEKSLPLEERLNLIDQLLQN